MREEFGEQTTSSACSRACYSSREKKETEMALKTRAIKRAAAKALKKGRRAVEDAIDATADYARPRIKQLQKAARPKIQQLKKAAEPKIKQFKKAAEPRIKTAKKAAAKAIESGVQEARTRIKNALSASSKKLKKAAKSI
jgi:membrane-associated HD superfamily phosphohydrolase